MDEYRVLSEPLTSQATDILCFESLKRHENDGQEMLLQFD